MLAWVPMKNFFPLSVVSCIFLQSQPKKSFRTITQPFLKPHGKDSSCNNPPSLDASASLHVRSCRDRKVTQPQETAMEGRERWDWTAISNHPPRSNTAWKCPRVWACLLLPPLLLQKTLSTAAETALASGYPPSRPDMPHWETITHSNIQHTSTADNLWWGEVA